MTSPAVELLRARADRVAPALLGWVLRSEIDGHVTSGRIVEVEAYLGADDPASHAAVRAGRTRRNSSMFGEAGRLYVYRSYGVHWCANVVTGPFGEPSAVLIRALEPVEGVETIVERRGRATDLCTGPGRVAQALAIGGVHDSHDLTQPPITLIPGVPLPASRIGVSGRIGVRRASERQLRFFDRASEHLSRR